MYNKQLLEISTVGNHANINEILNRTCHLDPDKYFQNVKIINFDIINHVSRGDPSEKSYEKHFAVKAGDFVKYSGADKKKAIGGALRNQDQTKQPIFVEKKVVLDHFKNK